MITPERRWPVRIAAGGLPLLLAFLLAPSQARAGCGHHVRITNPGQEARRADQPLNLPVAGLPLPEHRQPCRGPECSGGPAESPDAPPAPPSRTGGSDDLSLGLAPAGEGEPWSTRLPDDPRPRPTRAGPDISHPPR
jgi:hypothetical protein